MLRPRLAGMCREWPQTLGLTGKSSQAQKLLAVEIEGMVQAQEDTAVKPASAGKGATQVARVLGRTVERGLPWWLSRWRWPWTERPRGSLSSFRPPACASFGKW